METAYSGFALLETMVEKGNPNSLSDAGVGALALRSCIRGAFLNVKINAAGFEDKAFLEGILSKGNEIEIKSIAKEEAIIKSVNSKIQKE
jgi:glutamate formiminotransferase/formiminotetrahydrofolate cyclodeaminase